MHGKWTVRPIVGTMGTVGPRRLWMREVRDLVEGAPLTPFVRVAVAADFASPFANAGDQGLATSTATSLVSASPAGEGMDRLRGGQSPRHRRRRDRRMLLLYDQQGPIGTSTVAALAQNARAGMCSRRRPGDGANAHKTFNCHSGMVRRTNLRVQLALGESRDSGSLASPRAPE
jgi:hypothetical protein